MKLIPCLMNEFKLSRLDYDWEVGLQTFLGIWWLYLPMIIDMNMKLNINDSKLLQFFMLRFLSWLQRSTKQYLQVPNLFGDALPKHGSDDRLTIMQLRSVSMRLLTERVIHRNWNKMDFELISPILEFTKHANFSFHFKGPRHSWKLNRKNL